MRPPREVKAARLDVRLFLATVRRRVRLLTKRSSLAQDRSSQGSQPSARWRRCAQVIETGDIACHGGRPRGLRRSRGPCPSASAVKSGPGGRGWPPAGPSRAAAGRTERLSGLYSALKNEPHRIRARLAILGRHLDVSGRTGDERIRAMLLPAATIRLLVENTTRR